MKMGTPYWAITFNGSKAKTMNEKISKGKEVRDALKAIKNKFSSEEEAREALKSIPSKLHKWVYVAEHTPVSLGLGWI
jgi:hypothetical protein